VTSFAELSAEEQARQLRDPDGETGMATADALAAVNRAGNVFLITSLGLAPSDAVLEVGCGLATMAADVVAAADGIEYVGLDRSATMIEAARERHRDLIGAGRASFHLASTERVPFPDGRFSKVFSAGVIHFWPDPATPLAELRRVMQPGGIISMGCLSAEGAPPFAREKFGFHLRAPDEWVALARHAGFDAPDARVLGASGGPQMIHLLAHP
jgi:ubiquinone/menaquinone biosynthesis C-methylase UbiE